MGATHLPSIVINIALAAVPGQPLGFSTVLLIVPLAANSLDGDLFREYTTAKQGADDFASAFIDQTTLDAINVAFSQSPTPSRFLVGTVDIVGVQTYAAALQAIIDAGAIFFGVCIDSRVTTDIVSISTAVEPLPYLFCGASADATIKTGTLDPGFDTILPNEHTFMQYYDRVVGASAWPDVAEAVNRLAFNPDSISVPWNTPVQATAQLLATITEAERTFILSHNFNVGLPFASSSDFYIYQGLNMVGRQMHEIVSAIWFEQRLEESTSALIARLSSLGQKLPLNADGQARVIAEVNALYSQGIQAQHFSPDDGETEVYGEEITAADRAAFRLRISGRAQLLGSATDVEYTFAFSNEPLS